MIVSQVEVPAENSKALNVKQVCDILRGNDKFFILTHQSPDGDTLGSAFALCGALQRLGKKAKVLCSDAIPKKYDILKRGIIDEDFEPEYIVSVDIADTSLLGENLASYLVAINLCIDHHATNTKYAPLFLLDSTAAATAEIIFDIVKGLCIDISKEIATCIYTGITTDTGCFKYTNATAKSYRIAADMIEHGIDASWINSMMFDTKSLARLNIEKSVLDTLEFFCSSTCATIYVTKEMIAKTGADEEDTDGIASLPLQIEGVLVGITIKEKDLEIFKVSLRTHKSIDASKICAHFGGGGHSSSAGCTIKGSLQEVKDSIVSVVKSTLEDSK